MLKKFTERLVYLFAWFSIKNYIEKSHFRHQK